MYTATTVDKAHGRLEQRTISVVDVSNTNVGIPGIMQVAEITRTRQVLNKDKTVEETVCIITNLSFQQADAASLLALNRSYWEIENRLHYRKDVVFGEDRSTIRTKHGPQNMATLRNFAIGLMLSNGVTNIKRCVDNLQYNGHAFFRAAA